jgi:hypothetical protein
MRLVSTKDMYLLLAFFPVMAPKTTNLLPTLALALGGLTACDPALRLVFRNHTHQPILLTAAYSRLGRSDTTWQQSFPPGRTVHYFGIGSWNDTSIHRIFRRNYSRWEIICADDTLRLEGPSLVEFLSRCPRKGFLRSILLVDLK